MHVVEECDTWLTTENRKKVKPKSSRSKKPPKNSILPRMFEAMNTPLMEFHFTQTKEVAGTKQTHISSYFTCKKEDFQTSDSQGSEDSELPHFVSLETKPVSKSPQKYSGDSSNCKDIDENVNNNSEALSSGLIKCRGGCRSSRGSSDSELEGFNYECSTSAHELRSSKNKSDFSYTDSDKNNSRHKGYHKSNDTSSNLNCSKHKGDSANRDCSDTNSNQVNKPSKCDKSDLHCLSMDDEELENMDNAATGNVLDLVTRVTKQRRRCEKAVNTGKCSKNKVPVVLPEDIDSVDCVEECANYVKERSINFHTEKPRRNQVFSDKDNIGKKTSIHYRSQDDTELTLDLSPKFHSKTGRICRSDKENVDLTLDLGSAVQIIPKKSKSVNRTPISGRENYNENEVGSQNRKLEDTAGNLDDFTLDLYDMNSGKKGDMDSEILRMSKLRQKARLCVVPDSFWSLDTDSQTEGFSDEQEDTSGITANSFRKDDGTAFNTEASGGSKLTDIGGLLRTIGKTSKRKFADVDLNSVDISENIFVSPSKKTKLLVGEDNTDSFFTLSL